MGAKQSNPIPPPTYSPTIAPTMAPTTPIKVALTFFNAIQDDNQYYLSVNEVNGISWSSLPLKYGESVEFSKTVPTPVGYTGFDYSQYQVVRLTTNYIVANMFPFPLDNSNSLLVVAWNDAQNQIYTDALGTYGASNVACLYGPSRRVASFIRYCSPHLFPLQVSILPTRRRRAPTPCRPPSPSKKGLV
jgi:hypothetical protein